MTAVTSVKGESSFL